MKTTVDVPEAELEDILRFTRAATTREAIVMVIVEYKRRCRMAALEGHCKQGELMITPEQLQRQRGTGSAV